MLVRRTYTVADGKQTGIVGVLARIEVRSSIFAV